MLAVILIAISAELVASALNSFKFNSERCYDSLTKCAKTFDAFTALDTDRINAKMIVEFCTNHTYAIIPCVANKLGEKKKGSTLFDKSHILQSCIRKDSIHYPSMGEMMQLKKIEHLFLYGCVYNNVLDLVDTDCYNEMIRECINKNPPDRRCFQWECKEKGYNVFKKLNITAERERAINDVEEALSLPLSTNHELNIPTTTTELPYVFRQETLPLSSIDMKNTDDEDWILDPTRRQLAHIIEPIYSLQFITIPTLIMIAF
uniref:Uncharacterized protein n=1 Tax=Setaria digitata TaxID=48799 RepID=A0A915Q7Z8_9BILA